MTNTGIIIAGMWITAAFESDFIGVAGITTMAYWLGKAAIYFWNRRV